MVRGEFVSDKFLMIYVKLLNRAQFRVFYFSTFAVLKRKTYMTPLVGSENLKFIASAGCWLFLYTFALSLAFRRIQSRFATLLSF